MLIASRFQKRLKEACVMRRVLIATSLIAGLCLVGPISAQEAAKEGTKEGAKKASDVTADAAKDAGSATKEGAKKVGNTVTGTTYKATCNVGTSYSGKTKDGAYKDHGGVKSWDK
jgi:hypothetical protein